MSGSATRAVCEEIYRAALAAADPERAVRRAVRGGEGRGASLEIGGRAVPDGAPLVVLAAGKAAAAMAAALETLAGDRIESGLVVTKEGHGLPLRRFELREAGHPVPDRRSEAAGLAALERLRRAPRDAVVVVLLSGGASALLACPLPGLSLGDVARTTDLLLRAGADIDALNAVRKHLTALSGGRVALAAAPRRVELLALSDVQGDRLDVIGSGPCTPDSTTWADVRSTLDRCGVEVPALPRAVREHLEAGIAGAIPESPKPGDPAFDAVSARVVGSARDALDGAVAAARGRGLRPLVLTESLEGEARDAGRRLAALARALRDGARPCLLAAGETTVTVRGDGRGGRSQELALAAALEWRRRPAAPALGLLAAGTDGTDGPTDAAGAFADSGTVARGEALGLDAADALRRNDAYGFLAREGGLLRTGPTGTNVRDLVVMLECGRVGGVEGRVA